MKKYFLARAMLGFLNGAFIVNPLTLIISYLSEGKWLLCMPELIHQVGITSAVLLQTVLGAVLGMISFSGTEIFYIDNWSLLRCTVVHCILIMGSYIVVGLILHWITPDIVSVLTVLAIVVPAYAIVWSIRYTIWKNEMRKMTELTKNYQK